MPFTQEEFATVFALYNTAIWPMQIAAYVMGLVVAGLLWVPSRMSGILIPTLLAVMWLVNGVGYHWTFFAEINPAARVFAVLFVLQAALLGTAPLIHGNLHFRLRRDVRSVAGLVLIAFAMVAYPLWGWIAGLTYPAVPMFGVAPCPTTIFTIGVLLTADWRAVRWLAIIPALWALVGGSAAVMLGVPQDYGLIAALVVFVVLAVGRWQGRGFARHGPVPSS